MDSTIKQLLKEVNKKGNEGKRLVGVQEVDITASQNDRDRYILVYDNGPETANENW